MGDLHTHFDVLDIHKLNQRSFDLLFFTGDLGSGTRESSLEMARLLSGLHGSVLVMPGNNDTVDIRQLAAELTHRSGQNAIMAIAQQRQHESDIALCGYSLHRVAVGGRRVSLIAAVIQYARSIDKRVLAVVAGHMHLRTKQGIERPWRVAHDDVVYVNAARVPRIFSSDNDVFRHHVLHTLKPDDLHIEEVLLPEDE